MHHKGSNVALFHVVIVLWLYLGRMWYFHCMGHYVQVQLGCDALEYGLSGGQLHALVLPPV